MLKFTSYWQVYYQISLNKHQNVFNVLENFLGIRLGFDAPQCLTWLFAEDGV